ncbi:E3 ubiquitin ligase BIG BROTHER-related-like [Cucumis melo var. makuwa]|uniref:E3 ubiquitin ligase BIG BROTHER-related-like n=1 Tax=Cucumis melo var. makuwa TaxID=1194695 RepID=A0A5D3CF09_CUCMM|nr:E3 ubiquitin ligase BIG BROTHER-related-like [Cucumis melo var. makuwa]TYK08946.1 E3 ubiquitin ligase BIG BROTHER-related-like [Cucumis melo var. makuwa]
MSIFEYNGSAVVAMVGKNCFAIASDRRLGVQLQTIATDFQKIYRIHDKLFLGLSGLGTDAQTLYQRLVYQHKLYQLREERDMKPETFASLVSARLYEKRFGPYFCQPVIAGLSDEDKPFICTMDSIGAKELAKDFVVSGTASESLYGACEAMFKPDMEPEELFETISQALLSSVDRDCLSGWGGHVYVVLQSRAMEFTSEMQDFHAGLKLLGHICYILSYPSIHSIRSCAVRPEAVAGRREQEDNNKQQQQQLPQRISLAYVEQVNTDLIMALAMQQQEHEMAYTTLETIASESEEDESSDSNSNNGLNTNAASQREELICRWAFPDENEYMEGNEDGDYEGSDMDELNEDMEEDEDGDFEGFDLDELTYEELIALGEFIGEEKRGLPINEIPSCLHSSKFQTIENKSGIDRCVICQVEYDDGEELAALPCQHPYHSECIGEWLQIKRVCPICGTEVSSPNGSKNE